MDSDPLQTADVNPSSPYKAGVFLVFKALVEITIFAYLLLSEKKSITYCEYSLFVLFLQRCKFWLLNNQSVFAREKSRAFFLPQSELSVSLPAF